jgi:hypothetical protein
MKHHAKLAKSVLFARYVMLTREVVVIVMIVKPVWVA